MWQVVEEQLQVVELLVLESHLFVQLVSYPSML